MTEEIQNSEVPEVATQESQVSDQINEAANAKQEAEQRNWRAMRLKNAELEKRLKEHETMFDQALKAQLMSGQSSVKQEVDEFDSIGSDEFIPKGKVERLVEKKAQKYAEEIAKREVEKHIKAQNDSQFLDRLNRQYSDFSDFVNPETLSLLEEKEPELAQSIADLKRSL